MKYVNPNIKSKQNRLNAKYITHCGYSIKNNIASDIRLSRNVVNKESKSSRRFVRICNTSSGDNNYCLETGNNFSGVL